MAWDMGRKLWLGLGSSLVLACGDDTPEVVSTADDGTIGTITDTLDDSDTNDTFDSISASAADTWGEAEVTSITTFTESSITDSDTFESSVSDTFDSSASDSFTTSDTFETSISDSDTFETSSTFTETSVGTTETTDPSDTATTTDPSDTATTTDPSDTATTTTDPTDATTTDTTDTDTETGGGGFPEAPPFGTNILDLDLVGVWGLNWEPESGFDSVLDVDDQGNFMWTETSADCSTTTVASGYLWVEGVQIVMHVELWDRPLPWDTDPVLGETFPPPFRLRMSFSLQGSGPDDYLVLAAPGRVTEAAPYVGESYVQIDAQGDYLAGVWHGEAQLDAIPAGESDPVVIVRDTYEAQLELELAADDPQGFGTRVVTTQYFPVPQQTSVFDGANWTCLDGCPDPSGVTLVDGSNLYTYGPYAGFQHLMTFESGRAFRSGVTSDCP